MVTDLTAPIYVWCIAGDISTFPVGDATATMTPDGNAVVVFVFVISKLLFNPIFVMQTQHRLIVPITCVSVVTGGVQPRIQHKACR